LTLYRTSSLLNYATYLKGTIDVQNELMRINKIDQDQLFLKTLKDLMCLPTNHDRKESNNGQNLKLSKIFLAPSFRQI
jgi:hypothetical protein